MGWEMDGKETVGLKTCTTYIECQDTLLIERHVFLDHYSVADNRLSDVHVTGNVNIIPDVGVIQVDVIS